MRFSFDDAFEHQIEMQVSIYGDGTPIEDWSDATKSTFISMNILALTDELHEALAEVGWKPWASSRHLNRDAYKGELVDAFHFFMNLMMVAGIDSQELLEAYFEKAKVNRQRQKDGYDGVTSKCPVCGRALDDESTQCRRKNDFYFTCQQHGTHYKPVDEKLVSEA